MTDEIRYLGDVQRLALKPGDIIVITAEEPLTFEAVARIREEMKEITPANKVVVLCGGMKLEVVEDAA